MSRHSFGVHSYRSPTRCEACGQWLAGLREQGLQCSRCKIDVHEKCVGDASQKFACLNQAQASAAVPIQVDERISASLTSGEGSAASSSRISSVAHTFVTTTFTSPAFCCVDKNLIKGIYRQGVSCSVCGLAAHFKCQATAMSSILCDPDKKGSAGRGFAQLGNAMRTSFRRSSSDPDKEDIISISGPTNVHHVQGTTTGRTLVPIAHAQKDESHKREPVPVPSRPTSIEGSSESSMPVPVPSRPASIDSRKQGHSSVLSAPGRPVSDRLAGSRPSPPPVSKAQAEVEKMEIGSPTNVVHKTHTTFEASSGEYKGLPSEWQERKELSALNFGAGITEQPRVELNGYNERVPAILVLMGRELRRREGFSEEGIFRIAPLRSEQARIRALFTSSSSQGKTFKALRECTDAHVIAALMKEWCRMLKSSVLREITAQTLERLTNESFEENGSAPSQDILNLYNGFLFGNDGISAAPRATFVWLLDLMLEVAKKKDINKMNERAITTCFAPSIYVLEGCESTATDSIKKIKKVTLLLVNSLLYVKLFAPPDKSKPPRDTFGDLSEAITAKAKMTSI